MTNLFNRFLYYFVCVAATSVAGTLFVQGDTKGFLLCVMTALTLFGQYKFSFVSHCAASGSEKSIDASEPLDLPAFLRRTSNQQLSEVRYQRMKDDPIGAVDPDDVYQKSLRQIQYLHLFDDLKSAIDGLTMAGTELLLNSPTWDPKHQDFSGDEISKLKIAYEKSYESLHSNDRKEASKVALHIANLFRIEWASLTSSPQHASFSSALLFYQRAIADNSANFKARTRYAELLLQRGGTSEAVGELQKVLKDLKGASLEPPGVSLVEDVYLILGAVNLFEKKYQEAEKYFVSSLELSDQSLDSDRFILSLSCLGKTYFISKNYTKAEQLVKRFVATDHGSNRRVSLVLNVPELGDISESHSGRQAHERAWRILFNAFDSPEKEEGLTSQMIKDLIFKKSLDG